MESLLNFRYLLGVWRRRWYLLVLPTIFGAVISVAIAYALPPVYVANARILVESQQIPTELARSTVAADARERIQVIEERLKTRENLLDIAERFQVFAHVKDLTANETVERMRSAISMRVVSSSSRSATSTVSMAQIGFSAHAPHIAAQVANELLTQLLARNVQQRSARATETLDFFTRDVARINAELAEIESRITAYRREHEMAQPENLRFLRSSLESLERRAFDRKERRISIEKAHAALSSAIETGRLGGVGGLTPDERELDELERELARLTTIYAPSHPSRRTVERRIAALRERLAGAAAESRPGEEVGPPETPAMFDARQELERLEDELRLLDERDAAESERQAEIEAALQKAPEVAIELGAMTRRQSALQAQLASSVKKQSEAATGTRLEVNQQAERFEVVEAPRPPDKPVSPNRILIAGGGVVASIAAGLGLIFLVEMLRPAIRSPEDLQRKLQIRPIATIPRIIDPALRRRRYIIRVAVVASAILLPVLGAYLIDQFVMPLPLIAQKVLTRFGLDELLSNMALRLGW